ncbi:MAG: glutathione S-transferase N-terminal domain-containing protein [Gammaproteobacteria bacterium]|nr:glutathione S-transferase N-terminal domain-containing protein [Gammaproteobacteria bacterium]
MSIENNQVDDNLEISEMDRRSSMTLLSDPADIFCHCCRAALYEKDIELKVEYVSEDEDAERISTHNPFLELPVLIDREI